MPAEYKGLIGFVQFPPNEREVGEQTIRDFVISPMGGGFEKTPQVRVTLWPEYAAAEVAEGDLVAVDGKFTINTNQGKTYYNLSANKLVVNPQFPKSTEEVVNPVEDDEDEDSDLGF